MPYNYRPNQTDTFARMYDDTSRVDDSKALPWKYGERKCVISFFAPRCIPDETVRPYVYNFDLPFVSDLQETITATTNSYMSSYGGNSYLDAYMLGKPSVSNFLVPDSNGILFKAKYLSTCWTWVLFLDNEPIRGSGGSLVRLANRLVYTGFVAGGEEPVSQLFGRTTVNDRAVLIPTHHTSMNVELSRGVTGESMIVVPQFDWDVIDPGTVLTNSTSREYMLRPEDLTYSMGMSELDPGDDSELYESSYSVPELCSISARAGNVLTDSLHKSPRFQIAQIVRGLAHTAISSESDRLTTYEGRGRRDMSVSDSTAQIAMFKKNMMTSMPACRIGLQVNKPTTFGELLNSYPSVQNDIRVFKYSFDVDSAFDTDQAATPVNIWSSLLKSAVPAIMASCEVSDCSFFYASREPRRGDSIVIWREKIPYYERLVGPYPYIAEAPYQTDLRWSKLQEMLTNQAFSMVEDACSSDIECVIHYHASGECGVNLSILEMGQNDQFLVNNDILGGLTAPVLGTYEQYDNNISALSDVLNYTMDTKGF